MDTSRLPKQALQYKPKGRRNIGRPRKRWRDQLHLEDQGTGNTPKPSGTWCWWWWWNIKIKYRAMYRAHFKNIYIRDFGLPSRRRWDLNYHSGQCNISEEHISYLYSSFMSSFTLPNISTFQYIPLVATFSVKHSFISAPHARKSQFPALFQLCSSQN